MKKLLAFILGCILGALFAYALDAFGLQRCEQYRQDIRRWNYHYWGLQFPYWYAIGQAQQESCCRANIVSFDGGRGLMQFMPATERYVESQIGSLNVMQATDAIRANAWYMRQLHRSNVIKSLWLTYMFYNSGIATVMKEAERAGVVDYDKMRLACKRKKIKLTSGQILDLCRVGYEYPQKVFMYGLAYKTASDRMVFW